MATNYSLICWGGRLGNAVTVNASTDLITLTNHGLRDGTGVAFTSGTLPTVSGAALALNTIYFAKFIAASTFELYYDAALTSKIDFTSAGSSLVMKSAYFLALSDLSRWGPPGAEYIYDGLAAWYTARSAAANEYDAEVCEIGMAWNDYGAGVDINMIAPSVLITSRVNGVRSSAFHSGILSAGYGYTGNSFGIVLRVNGKAEGFTCSMTATSGTVANLQGIGASVSRMIFRRLSGVYNVGVNLGVALTSCTNCIFTNLATGLTVQTGSNECLVANNTAVACTTGFNWPTSTNKYGYWYNNLAIGCTNNWAVQPTPLQRANRNAGMVGDANLPWTIAPGTYVQIGADWNTTTPLFMDYANGDLRPWSSGGVPNANSALLAEAGVQYYNAETTDIADNVRPAYMGGGPAAFDIGAFELDPGFGPWPASHTLTLSNVVVGSRVMVRDQAKTVTHYNEIATSSTVSITVTVYGDARDNWLMDVRKASAAPFYQRYKTLMTVAAGTSSHYVNQLPDQR